MHDYFFICFLNEFELNREELMLHVNVWFIWDCIPCYDYYYYNYYHDYYYIVTDSSLVHFT